MKSFSTVIEQGGLELPYDVNAEVTISVNESKTTKVALAFQINAVNKKQASERALNYLKEFSTIQQIHKIQIPDNA